MTKAIWNGCTLAESDDIVVVEGNAYFPRADVDWGYLQASNDIAPTYCHWKGMAEYYDIFAGGNSNMGAAWSYPDTYDEAAKITALLREDKVAQDLGAEIRNLDPSDPSEDHAGESTGARAQGPVDDGA